MFELMKWDSLWWIHMECGRESRVAILLVAILRRDEIFDSEFQEISRISGNASRKMFSTRINDDSGHLGIIFQNLDLFSKWTVLPFQIFCDIFSDQLWLLEIDP